MASVATTNELPLQQDPFTTGPQFEAFCGLFLRERVIVALTDAEGRETRYEIAGVEPRKAPGHKQGGRDFEGWAHRLTVAGRTDDPPERWFFECKHRRGTAPFGLADAKTAVKDCPSPEAARKILLVSHPFGEVAELRRLHPAWDVWDTRRLLDLVLDLDTPRAAKLIHRCFGASWVKQLVPGAGANASLLYVEAAYENELRNNRLFHHPEVFCGSTKALDSLLAEIAAGAQDGPGIVLLLGGGGAGKSRLLIEMARRLAGPEADEPRETLFVNSLASPLELETEYFEPRSVLVLDDAHLWPKERLLVMRAALAKSEGMLVVAARPQIREELNYDARVAGYDAMQIKAVELPLPWKPMEVRELVGKLLPSASKTSVNELVRLADGSPLLATLAAQLINTQNLSFSEVLTTKAFREEVFNCFAKANLRPLAEEADEAEWMRLLELLAILSPVENADDFITRAARFLEWSEDRVDLRVKRLGDTGILQISEPRGRSATLRVWPDVFSDHLVSRACVERRTSRTRFARRVNQGFGHEEYPGMLRNLAMAAWTLAQTDAIAARELMADVVADFRRTFDEASWYDRRSLLRRWGDCTRFLPDETLDLIEHILTLQEAPVPADASDSEREAEENRGRPNLLDTLPPLLGTVASHYVGARQRRALDLLWTLSRERKGPILPWRKSTLEQLNEIVAHGLKFNFEIVTGVWQWVRSTIETQRAVGGGTLSGADAVLSELLVPFIAREVIESEWEDDRVWIGDRTINAEETQSLRDDVFTLAEEIAVGDDPPMACALLPFLRRAAGREKWGIEWLPDQVRAVRIGGQLLQKHTQPVVQFTVRRFLLETLDYADEPVLANAINEALKTVRWSTEMDVLLACASGLDDFAEPGAAGGGDYHRRMRAQSEFIHQLPTKLTAELDSPSRFVQLLAEVAGEAERFGLSFSTVALGKAILSHDSNYALAVAASLPELGTDSLDWMWWSLLDRRDADAAWRQERLNLARAVFSFDRASFAAAVIFGLGRWLDGEAEREFAVKLAGHPHGDRFQAWISAMHPEDETPFGTWREILQRQSTGELNAGVVREVFFRVGELGRLPADKPRREVMALLLGRLTHVADLGDSAAFSLGEAVKHYHNEIMAFIFDRLRQSRDSQVGGFKVLPGGATPLPDSISAAEQTHWMGKFWEMVTSGSDASKRGALSVFQWCFANAKGALGPFLIERIGQAAVPAELLLVASILSQGEGPRIGMPWLPNTIRNALITARERFPENATAVEGAFFDACVPRACGWSGGQPNERTQRTLDNLRRLKSEWAHDPLMGGFFARALGAAESRFYQR